MFTDSINQSLNSIQFTANIGKAMMAREFDAQEFVSKCRDSGTSLVQIREGMEQYVKKIKAHLVTHVNNDYEKFVTLSTGLHNFDETVGSQKELLEDLRTRVAKMRDVVSDTLRQFRNKMSERRDLKVRNRSLSSRGKHFKLKKKKNAKGTTKCIGNVYENNTFP